MHPANALDGRTANADGGHHVESHPHLRGAPSRSRRLESGQGKVTFHPGTGPGYTAWLARYADDRLTIAVMSNSDEVHASRIGRSLAMEIL